MSPPLLGADNVISAAGDLLAFQHGTRKQTLGWFDRAGRNVGTLPLPTSLFNPRISPDGRYVAYLSNQSGREEVYLARLPGVTAERQVSVEGAENSRAPLAWSRKRQILYFLGAGGTLQSVPIATSPELRIGKPTAVPGAPANVSGIEAAPDGRLLLLYAGQS